ncbi:MAG: sulfotransferase [Candidatus Paceibacteria bacterium]
MFNKGKKIELNFVGIGAPRCGTTWLYKSLQEHPEICMCEIKDINFFRDADKDWRDLNKYSKYFECKDNQITGEFSAGYFSDEESRKRLKKLFPNIKIILSIREPVTWAVSAYLNNIKHKDKVENIDKKIQKKYDQPVNYYSKNLEQWIEFFSEEQIHIIVFEKIKSEPKQVLKNLYNFLGVNSDFTP